MTAGPATGVPPGYDGPGSFEAVPVPPDGYVPGRFVPAQAIPEAKAFALEQAVNLCRQDRDSTAKEVIEVAEVFEEYLTGKEAP
jgi:hypothetical protein